MIPCDFVLVVFALFVAEDEHDDADAAKCDSDADNDDEVKWFILLLLLSLLPSAILLLKCIFYVSGLTICSVSVSDDAADVADEAVTVAFIFEPTQQ